MINCLIENLLSVANFQCHIMNNNLIDAMFSYPGIIDIYVQLIFWYGDRNIYWCARCKILLSLEVEFESSTFILYDLLLLEEGWSVGWVEKMFTNSTGMFLLFIKCFKPALKEPYRVLKCWINLLANIRYQGKSYQSTRGRVLIFFQYNKILH